jgi:hypothetical protein
LRVDADDHLIKAADFSLTSACPMNGLVTARSALRPQAGQIAVGVNTREISWLEMSANLDDKELGLAYKRVHAEILGSFQDFG